MPLKRNEPSGFICLKRHLLCHIVHGHRNKNKKNKKDSRGFVSMSLGCVESTMGNANDINIYSMYDVRILNWTRLCHCHSSHNCP